MRANKTKLPILSLHSSCFSNLSGTRWWTAAKAGLCTRHDNSDNKQLLVAVCLRACHSGDAKWPEMSNILHLSALNGATMWLLATNITPQQRSWCFKYLPFALCNNCALHWRYVLSTPCTWYIRYIYACLWSVSAMMTCITAAVQRARSRIQLAGPYCINIGNHFALYCGVVVTIPRA